MRMETIVFIKRHMVLLLKKRLLGTGISQIKCRRNKVKHTKVMKV